MRNALLGMGLIALVLTSCSEVSRRGDRNFGVKQLLISQAGICNNLVTISKGKIDSSPKSDGWSMIDLRTDELIRISGDAVIKDATKAQENVYLSAPTLAQAQKNLNEQIQKDGTILPQPDSCKQSGEKK
jgi:hypothetical protein